MTVGDFWLQMRAAVKRFSRQPRKTRNNRDRRRALLGGELLERREYLSANQISFDALNGQISIAGTTGAEQISVTMDSATIVRVRAQSPDGLVESTFQRATVQLIYYYGGDGNDRFENITNIPAVALGQGGDDTLIGGSAADTLQGGDGNDELVGNAGDDILLGGTGNDTLRGGDGNDRLHGESGNDWADGAAGNDIFYGDDGNDTLLGGTGNDNIFGGSGIDVLNGGAGDDRLQGEQGGDWLYGEDGSDTLLGGVDPDQLYGGEGNDFIYGEAGDDWADGMGGNDYLSDGAGRNTMRGGIGDDTLAGGDDADWLLGDDGSDTLFGNGGNDQLEGGAGNDILLGDFGDDFMIGGLGDDSVYGGVGNDYIEGGDGHDNLHGGDGNDVALGGAGNDQLRGHAGDDTLYGGDGDDELYGFEGNDQLYGEIGNDSLLGGIGNDSLFGAIGDDYVFGEDGNDVIDGGDGHDYLHGGLGDDAITAGLGNDGLYGNDGNDTLLGGDGDDRLEGGNGADRLDAGAGTDYLLAGAGNDTLLGGNGDDEMIGEDGDDWLNGNAGNDRLIGGNGNDTLLGADGNDQLYGYAGNDTLMGQAGNDHMQGMEGNDTIFGGAGNDYLIGNEGNDWLQGEAGDDELVGVAESDFLFGGLGNDRLWSQTGQHLFTGGGGDDILSGGSGNDVLIGGTGRDQISGSGGEDLLIGGSTIYDESYVQLSTLFAAWSGAASYAARVAQIESSAFAVQLQSNATVMDDSVADQVFGGDGQDWFFLTGYVAIYDPNYAADHDHSGPGSSPTNGHSHAGVVVLDQPPALEGFAFVDSLDRIGDRTTGEALHTLIPHADDISLQREHLTLSQLVRYDQVTHYAVTSGVWSSPSTWSDGVVPGNGARVLIPIGVDVTVNQIHTTRINTIRVDGTLSFSTAASTELRVDTIVVTNVGRFEMGTEEAPIPAHLTSRVVFTDNGAIDRVADPFALGRGLISHGSVSIHGAAVTAKVAINGPAMAGATVLSLKSTPAGWKVGDTIVLAGTYNGSLQNELRRIVAINGNQVMIDRSLSFNHVPLTASQEIHVANTTRNVQFTSEASDAERRGHVMFMHNRDVHVANAGFYELGRTNKDAPINDPVVNANWQLSAGTGTNPRARYSVHFHRTGSASDGNPSTISGSVVVDSPGWGFVNHSSYVDMVGNVAYAVNGAAFVTEVGDEIGSFIGNVAIGTTGSGEDTESRLGVQDFGHQGDGFWLQGPGVSLASNVSAGNDGSAFFLFARGLIVGGVRQQFLSANLPNPALANGAEKVSVESVPIKLFNNNVGYSSEIGLSAWYHLGAALDAGTGLFSNSTFWGNTNGVDLPYSNQVVLRNLTISRTPEVSPFPTQSNGVNGNLVTRNIRYENLTVSGFWRGISFPRRGSSVVVGGNYDNHLDFHIMSGIAADRSVLITGTVSFDMMVMDAYFDYPVNPGSYAFLQDQVTLNFGSFQNRRVYYGVQSPIAVPFPAAKSGIPAEYIGKTSLQLWTQYGVAVGGTLAPANAVSQPWLSGLI